MKTASRYFLDAKSIEALEAIQAAHFHNNASAAVRFAVYTASKRVRPIQIDTPQKAKPFYFTLDDEIFAMLGEIKVTYPNGLKDISRAGKLRAALQYAATKVEVPE